MTDPLDLVLSRLKGVKKNGSEVMARCPAHEDRTPSLSISLGREGKVLVYCHAGCNTDSVLAGMGLTAADLFDGTSNNGSRPEIVEEYDYTDEGGGLLFQVVRYFPKTFKQRVPDAFGGWDWKLGDTRRVLYRLPAIIEAVALGKTIYIVEGEKDVAAIESVGGAATCNPGGAGKWRSEYSEMLRGATVRIIADNDKPGREHARKVAAALEGVADAVEVLQPRTGNDPADHIEAGHALDDFDTMTEDTESEVFMSLRALMENPEMLAPPENVLPRLAYRGRAVAVISREKGGKSTFIAHGAAALSRGRDFLGEPTTKGRVVWVGLEEHPSDAVRRFVALDADPDAIHIIVRSPRDVLAQIRDLLTEWPADLLVIDSLAEYARVTLGKAPDSGDSAGWGLVVRPLVALTRDFPIALNLAHHANKGDGEFRDSTEIVAAVDAFLTLRFDQNDPTVRNVEGRGRWPINRFSVALRDGLYDLASGAELSIDVLVLLHIETNPGCSYNSVRKAVQGTNTKLDAVVNQLIERGAVEDRGTSVKSKLFATSGQGVLEGVR